MFPSGSINANEIRAGVMVRELCPELTSLLSALVKLATCYPRLSLLHLCIPGPFFLRGITKRLLGHDGEDDTGSTLLQPTRVKISLCPPLMILYMLHSHMLEFDNLC
jgi:hypothetical protein